MEANEPQPPPPYEPKRAWARLAAVMAAVVMSTTACIPGPAPRVAEYLWGAATWWANSGTKAPLPNYIHPIMVAITVPITAAPKVMRVSCAVIAEPADRRTGRPLAPYTAVDPWAWIHPVEWFRLCHSNFGRGIGPAALMMPTIKITKDENSPAQRPAFECIMLGPPSVGSLGRGQCEYVGPSAIHSTNMTVWRRGYVQVI